MNEEKNMREEQKPAAVAVPVGATHYQPHQKAYYKRLSATEWQLLAESRKEWIPSPGTSDSAQWVTLQAIQAPQPSVAAQETVAHDWRHSPSYGGEICASCGAAKGTRRGKAPCGEVSEKQSPVGYLYDWVSDDGVVHDWFSQDYDVAHSPTNQCHNIRPLYAHPATQQPAPAAQGDVDPLQGAANGLLEALERLSAQCERLRLPGQPETDAEKTARAVIAKATGGAA